MKTKFYSKSIIFGAVLLLCAGFLIYSSPPPLCAAENILTDDMKGKSGSNVRLDEGVVDTPYGGIGRYGNLLTYSEAFNDSSWTKDAGITLVTTDDASILAPDGTATAEKLTFTGASGHLHKDSILTGANTASKTFTFSIWLRTNSGTLSEAILVRRSDGSDGALQNVTLTTSWQRFSVTRTFDATTTSGLRVDVRDLASGTVYCWGAQVEEASTHGVYIKTTSTVITASRGIVANANLVQGGNLTLGGNLYVNGSGPHYFSNGSVGIGTTEPNAKLDVAVGSFDSGIYFTGNRVRISPNADGWVGKIVSNGTTWMAYQTNLRLETSNSGHIQLMSAGNVGIGTTGPGAPLQVNGNAWFGTSGSTYYDAQIALGGSTGQNRRNFYTWFGDYASGGYVGIGQDPYYANWSMNIFAVGRNGNTAPRIDFITGSTATNSSTLGDASVKVSIINNGNVGIGTIGPGALLDVNGTTRAKVFQMNDNASGGLSLYSGGSPINHGIAFRSTASAGTYGDVTAADWSDYFFSEDGLNRGWIWRYNNSTNVASISNRGYLAIAGNLTVNGTGNSSIAGNVGIGTTGPTYRLQIGTAGSLADSIRIGSYAVANNTRQYIGYARADTGLFESAGEGDSPSTVKDGVSGIRIVNTVGTVVPAQADNSVQLLTHIYNGGSRVALHANYDGNVGIGITTPGAYKLNVNGNTNITGTLTTTGAINGQTIGADSALNALIVGGGYGSSGITMDASGNLQVDGNIYLKGTVWKEDLQQLLVKNNTIRLNSGGSSQDAKIEVEGTGAATLTTIQWNYSASNWSIDKGLNITSGNVGIGTTDPAADLTVRKSRVGGPVTIYTANNDNTNGASDAVLQAQVGTLTGGGTAGDPYVSLDVWGVAGWSIGIDNSDSDKLKFDQGGSAKPGSGTKMTIQTDGNVGIGTTGPDVKLTINGDGSSASGIALQESGSERFRIYTGGGTDWVDLMGQEYLIVKSNAGNSLSLSRYGISVGSSYVSTAPPTGGMIISGNVGIGTTGPADKLQVYGGYVSDITGRVARNLLDTNIWTVSNDSIGNWSAIQSVSGESQRVWYVDPFGRPALVWKDVTNAVNDASGGWEYSNIPIDNNKAYRLTVWVQRTNTSSGNVYLGCNSGNTNNLDGTQNSNPYFFAFAANNLQANRWYLLVGYIHAANDSSTTNYSAVYDGVTGQKILTGTDFKNRGATNYQVHRAFDYYDTTAGTIQYQWGPRFEQIDGSEPSIEALLGNNQSATIGGNAYFAGSVGIGTTNPGAPLQVYRNVNGSAANLAETVSQATLILNRLRADTDQGLFFGIAGGNYIQGNNSAGNSASNILLNPYGGSIGIGTTAPNAKLDVWSTVNASPTTGTITLIHPTSYQRSSIVFPSRVNWTSDYGFIEYRDDDNDSGEAAQLTIGTSNDGDDDVVIDPSGRLTISATNATLDTSGNLGVSGVVTASGGNSGNWNTAYGWGNHAFAGYDTTNDSWTGTGNVYTTSGNVGIGTTSFGTGEKFKVAAGSETTLFGTIDGTTSSADGNASLKVVKKATASNANVEFWTAGTQDWVMGTGIAATDANFRLYAGTGQVVLTAEKSGAVSNTLYLKAGNVGIGTTNPGYALQISQGGAPIYGPTLHLKSTEATGNTFSALRFTVDNGGLENDTFRLYATDAGDFTMGEGNGSGGFNNRLWFRRGVDGGHIVLQPSGNVGIGATNPGYKLDVQGGDINASGNLREAGTTLSSKYAPVSGSGNYWKVSGSWNPMPSWNRHESMGYNGGELVTYENSNQMSIVLDGALYAYEGREIQSGSYYFNGSTFSFPSGTISNTAIDPDSYDNKIVIGNIADGSGWSSNGIGFGGTAGQKGAIAASSGSLYIGMQNGSAVNTMTTIMQHDASTRYTYFNAGNVGIGTTNPGYKLDVNGTVNVAAFNVSGYNLATSQFWGAASWSQSGLISFTAGSVNDGSISGAAFHTDTSAAGSWLQLDAGSAKTFTRLAIYSGSGGSAQNLSQWNIQYSDNATDWSTAYVGFDLTHNKGGWVEVRWALKDVVPAHRYWRLYKTNAAQGGGYVYEVQFYEAPGEWGIVRTDAAGNVGIGTTDPGANKLKVQGDMTVTGAFNPATIGAHTVSGNLTVNGNISAVTTGSNMIYYRFLRAPDSNLHLDAASGAGLYLNYYQGSVIYFGSGAGSHVAVMDTSANFYPSNTNTGSLGTSANKWSSLYTYGNSYLAANAGSVGIGTTAPYQKLDLQGGSLRIGTAEADYSGTNFSYTDGGTGTFYFTGGRYGQDWYWRSSSATGTKNHMRLNGPGDSAGGALYLYRGSDQVAYVQLNTNGDSYLTGGDVGIGTTDPSIGKLVISGTLATMNPGANWDKMSLWSDGVKSYIQSSGDESGLWISSSSEKVHIDDTVILGESGGNVGIGTTAPQYKLDVGPMGGAQSATAGSLGLIRNNAAADSSPYTQARLFIYGGAGVDGSNYAYFGYGADAQLRQVYSRTASAATMLWGTTSAYDGTGTFTQTMSLSALGNLTNLGTLTVQGTGNSSIAGNVGIGTTSPGAKLDVKGAVRVGDMEDTNYVSTTWNFTAKPAGWYRFASNSGNRANATFELRENADHSILVLRVGSSFNNIANASVTVLNHNLYGSATFQKIRLLTKTTYDPQYVEVYVNPHNNDNNTFYCFIKDNLLNSGWSLLNFDTGSIPAGYTSTEYDVDEVFVVAAQGDSKSLRLDRAGNVGIGTMSPGATLDVTGSIRASGNITSTGGGIGGWSTGTGKVYVTNTSDNVGIGTTDPGTYKLNVAGTLLASGAYYLANAGESFGLNDQRLYIRSDGDANHYLIFENLGTGHDSNGLRIHEYGGFRFSTSSGDKVEILQNGNVGIGTTVPVTKLDFGASNTGHIGLGQYNGPASTNRFVGLYGGGGSFADGSGATGIYFRTESDSASGSIGFLTHSSGASNTTRMMIDKAGNVGIGTTDPSAAKLVVAGNIVPSTTGGGTLGLNANRWANIYLSNAGNIYFGSGTDDYLQLYDVGTGTPSFRFVQDSSTKFVIDGTTGNVGIGTTTPGAALAFANSLGDKIFLYNGASYDRYGLAIQSNELRNFTGNLATNSFTWGYLNNATGAFNEWARMTSGYLGIGTTVPATKLDVNGVITATSGNSGQWNTAYTHSQSATGAEHGATSAVSANMIVRRDGNGYVFGNYFNSTDDVSAGTVTYLMGKFGDNYYRSATAAKVQSFLGLGSMAYVGSVSLSGVLSGSGTSSISASFNNNASYPVLAADGNGLKFWNGSDSYKISMGNAAEYHYGPVTDYSIKTAIDSNANTRGFTWGQNSVAPIAALNVGNGNFQTAGTITASGGNSGNWNTAYGWGNHALAGYDATNDSWTGTGDVYTTSGNVGIGTAVPGGKLDVAGPGMFFSTQTAAARRIFEIQTGASAVTLNSSFLGASSVVPLAFAIDSSEKMRIATNGTVGIGTTGPLDELHIYKSVDGSIGPTIRLENPNVSVGTAASLDFDLFGSDAIGARVAGIRTNAGNFESALALYTANSGGTLNEWMRITTAGNVGIGTTGPASKLHIEGNISLARSKYIYFGPEGTTGEYFYENPSGTVRLHSGGADVWVAPNNSTSWYTPLKFGVGYTDPGTAQLAVNGNVGIGTTTPYAALSLGQVTGERLSIYDNAVSTARWGIGVAAQDFQFYTAITNGFSFRNNGFNGTTLMKIAGDGNVGIGTTGPGAKLDIYGSIAWQGINVAASANGGTVTEVSGNYPANNTSPYTTGAGSVADWGSSNAIDGDTAAGTSTSTWIDANGENGITFIKVTFNKTYIIDRVRLAGRYDAYTADGQPQEFQLDFSDGSVQTFTFPSSYTGMQEYMIRPVATSFIRYTTRSKYSTGNNGLRELEAYTRYTGATNSLAENQFIFYNTAKGSGVQANVGIGTTGPLDFLDIKNTRTSTTLTGGSAYGGIHLIPSGTDNSFVGITFGGNSSQLTTTQAGIISRSDNSTGADLRFGTTDSYASGMQTRMMINPAGNVGIGTTSPPTKLQVYQTQNAHAVSVISTSGTYGASVLVGTTTTPNTLVDTNIRPMVYLRGSYPVLTLDHTATSNDNHGPTIQFAFDGYSSNRQILIGADGQGQRLDFGFSGGSNGTNTDKNPHNGIAGYQGVTPMRLFPNGLLVGATGTYPNEITSTSYALDVRGTAYVSGAMTVGGYLTKSGGGFTIDHPLDPANKILTHSFVESPDMKNLYDGVVILGEDGESTIELPEWFEALNKDFRYQLTPIGKSGMPYVKEEIKDNKFTIAGDPGMKVSWQVTGTRKDAWAEKHRPKVEEEKGSRDGLVKKGEYIAKDCFEEKK